MADVQVLPDDVWPVMAAENAIYCAALFIDVRGSSQMSASHETEAPTVALRTCQLVDETRRLWGDAPPPTTVRSVGDGLFCVWVMNEAETAAAQEMRSALLEQVLILADKLPEVLKTLWRVPVELGMGLACGSAAKAKVGTSTDYYGYVINLAAKLQNLARPGGVVVLNSFVDVAMQRAGAADGVIEITPRFRSEVGFLDARPASADREAWLLHRRHYELPFAKSGGVDCLVTPQVDEVHGWTCLAWPGFAISRDGDAEGRRLGLNTRGITVLTHQGLKGNIGTLRIWPRNNPRKHDGDRFELIIDDYDSLAEVNASDPRFLARGTYSCNLATLALREQTSGRFFFVPIRSGLNALAWHKGRGAVAAGHETYLETVEAAALPKNWLRVGLYDNVGASLPILIDGLNDLFLHDVFSAGENDMNRVIERLRVMSKGIGSRKLFTIYNDIERLAGNLRIGKIHAVLGGGAWLACNDAPVQNIASRIPPNASAFLWIEGAAVVAETEVKQVEQIKSFLDSTILEYDYQRELMRGQPYGSCPVNAELVSEILSDDGAFRASLTPAEQAIYDEIRQIYDEDSVESTSQRILLRRLPDDVELWQRTWQTIKTEFCISDN